MVKLGVNDILFLHEVRIKDRGRRGLVGTLTMATIFGTIDLYLLHQPIQIGHVVGLWFAGLLLLLISLMTIWCLTMIRNNEGWKVMLSADRLLWQTPSNSSEPNFCCALQDITQLQLKSSNSPAIADEYWLSCSGSPPVQLISGTSDIPLQPLIKKLQEAGIEVQTATAKLES